MAPTFQSNPDRETSSAVRPTEAPSSPIVYTREAYARLWPLPTCVHHETGALLKLSECALHPERAVPVRELTVAQQLALIEARWLAGDWSDIMYGIDGLADLDRARRELNAQGEIGQALLKTGLRAIEMTLEFGAAHVQVGCCFFNKQKSF